MALNHIGAGVGLIFRSENQIGGSYGYTDMEKRQLFLRSYQFSRKTTTSERMKKSLVRVKRVVWVRLRSVRKIRKMIWFRLRNGLFYGLRRRRRFIILHNPHNSYNRSSTSCFCYVLVKLADLPQRAMSIANMLEVYLSPPMDFHIRAESSCQGDFSRRDPSNAKCFLDKCVELLNLEHILTPVCLADDGLHKRDELEWRKQFPEEMILLPSQRDEQPELCAQERRDMVSNEEVLAMIERWFSHIPL